MKPVSAPAPRGYTSRRFPDPLRLPFPLLLALLWGLPLLSPRGASALEADEIALVVNTKVPAGVTLAAFYAEQRHVPPGRVIRLELPDGDDIAYDAYDAQVVPAVRGFLKDNGLENKVTCLVTFYGVPLRIGGRPVAPAETQEFALLDKEFKQAIERTRGTVKALEDVAKQFNPSFKPTDTNEELPALPARAEAAVASCLKSLDAEKDPAKRGAAFTTFRDALEALCGPLETAERLGKPEYAAVAPEPLTPRQAAESQEKFKKDVAELNSLQAKVGPQSRARMREILKSDFGMFRYDAFVGDQRARLDTSETESAFDSELALARWPDGYVRHRWIDNPLHYRLRNNPRRQPTPPVLMVTRLDGPDEKSAHDLIATSVRVEQKGLTGQVVLDARGKPASDPYGAYDQTIRNLANLLRAHTDLKVTLDDAEPVLPPHSQRDAALYCGWYSLRKYVPACAFNPGAVGFHVASSELIDLHNRGETGWVRGLMSDGVVGTLGPVAEPYLQSFPRADEFFPLLLTGKLPLAEVYWKTNPMVSWMQTLIGDPLYTPYKTNPALREEDVPPGLRLALEPPEGRAMIRP